MFVDLGYIIQLNKIVMKTKSLKVWVLLFGGIAMMSCAQESLPMQEESIGEKIINVSIDAQIPDYTDGSKTTFDGQTLVWTGNETMDLLIGNTSSVSASNSKSVALSMNAADKTFSGTISLGNFGEADLRAVCIPSGKGAYVRYENGYHVNLPVSTSQVQAKNGVMDGDNFPLYAPLTESDLAAAKGPDGTYLIKGLELKWGCAVLRFNVFGQHPDMAADEVLKSITIKYENPFPAYSDINLTTSEIKPDGGMAEATVSLTEEVTIADKTSADGVKVFMAMYPRIDAVREVRVNTSKATYTLTKDVETLAAFDGEDLTGKVWPVGLDMSKFMRVDNVKLDYYKKKVLSIIKRAGLPSIQVTYTKGDNEKISFVVVNETIYNERPSTQQQVSPHTTSSIYLACSMGKVPMSYIVMKLVEEGKVNLDDKIVNYFDNPDDNVVLDMFADDEGKKNAKNITVRSILLHTTGMNNSMKPSNLPLTDADASKGTYKYSTTAIHALDLTMAAVIGKPLEDYENDYIFDKIGMTHSSYKWIDIYDTYCIKGMMSNGNYAYTFGWNYSDAGKSLRTTSEEYTKFLRWILDGADFIGGTDSEYYKAMFAKYGVEGFDNAEGTKWQGLIWRIEDHPEMGLVYHHRGQLDGFRAWMAALPETDETIVFLANGDTSYNFFQPMSELFLGHATDIIKTYGKALPPEESDTSADAGKIKIEEE